MGRTDGEATRAALSAFREATSGEEAEAGAAAERSAEAPRDTLGRRAVTGSMWVGVGYGASQAIRFLSNLVLTRLLFPEAFGLMLLVNVFLHGLQMFSDLGVGTSIVQNARSDDRFLNTAWTIQALRGVLLWSAALLLAWPFAALYGEPRLMWMLPVAGVTALLDGFVATAVATANRNLRMSRLLVFELAVQATAIAVMIGAAWVTRSVWALLTGGVVAAIVRVALSHAILPGVRNRLLWDPGAAASLLHFGKWVFVSSMLTFLAQQGDRLLFGKLLALGSLGVYNIALSLCDAPVALIGALSFRVFFPLFSELRRTTHDVGAAYHRSSSAVALLAGAGALVLIVAGPMVVQVLYDDRYAAASWIVRLLAFGIGLNALVQYTGAVVLATGQVKTLAMANAARLLWIGATLPIAFGRWGFAVAIVFVALADLPKYVVLGLGCRRGGLHIFRADARRALGFAVAAAVALLSLRATGQGAQSTVIATAIGLAIWACWDIEALHWYALKARGYVATSGRRA